MHEELVALLRKKYDMAPMVMEAADAIEELQEDNAALNGTVSNLIGQIAELRKPNWVPVTERLPEEKRDGLSEDVLVLVENPDGDITWQDIFVGYYLYAATSEETGWWTMMTCGCAKIGEHQHGDKIFPANEYVTHWMPLPQPPKEEA